MSTEVPARQKLSKHAGRNTCILRPYVKNLGYSIADREESLTVKFRDSPSHENRLYTMFLGCGLREDENSSAGKRAARPNPSDLDMPRGHVVVLMARVQEKLIHEGRTVQGIFEALGVGARHVNLKTYSEALEHMSVRAGTAIPLGMAEKALDFLCRHTNELWPFLHEDLVRSSRGQGVVEGGENTGSIESGDVSNISPLKSNDSGAEDSGNDSESRRKREVSGGQRMEKDGTVVDSIAIDDNTEIYPLAQISSVLEAFTRSLGDDGVSPEDFPLQDLINFLYLGGHAKISLSALKVKIEKHGWWALERSHREQRAERAQLAEATRSAKAGKAFALTDRQLDAAVDFLDPNQDGSIDLQELMQAFKQHRTAMNHFDKNSQRRSGVSIGVGSGTEMGESLTSPEMENPAQNRGEDEKSSGQEFEGSRCQIVKEDRALFSSEEAKLLTTYIVGTQQAFSLMSVVDIQRGIKGAKRATAQVAARNAYRRAAGRFADELRSAGMVLETDDGWTRWFELCELGLRYGGDISSQRRIGRTELKRGLKKLALKREVDAADGARDSDAAPLALSPASGWSELEVDELLIGLVALQGGDRESVEDDSRRGGEGIEETFNLKDNEFREKLVLATTSGKDDVDRELEAGQAVMPLVERFEHYLKNRGMRMGQLFELMTTWAKSAPEDELLPQILTKGFPSLTASAAQRGDDSWAPPSAMLAVLTSLRVCGLTGAERARAKADMKLKAAEEEERRVAKEKVTEISRRMGEAEMSGASGVLGLLQTSIESKSIRVIELFNAIDTSEDGLLSREELREGLQIIAEGSLGDRSSMNQLRKDCHERRRLAADRARAEKEKQGTNRLRARIAAAEGSGAARVLRRIHDHVVQKRVKMVDMFRSLSLRGHTDLTPPELEMALSLIDGLDLTRREIRSVARFLDKDRSGTIDVRELENAIREFRELSRDLPSLGSGPMTVVDPSELRQLANSSFLELMQASGSHDWEGDNGPTYRQGEKVVSVSDISEAFEEAFRQRQSRIVAEIEEKKSVGATGHPASRQLSAETKRAQACIDEVMSWLRSSRTFPRTPTGRMPTLAEQMTEREKMELELQNKLQEKRRRAAGQRHWEEWVACKARRRTNSDENASNGGTADQRRQEEAESANRKQQQNEAFSAWVREKDKIVRARRRQERRAKIAMESSEIPKSINFKQREARTAESGTRFPQLGGRPVSVSSTSVPRSTPGYYSFATAGTRGSITTSNTDRGSKHGRAPSRAERKNLDRFAAQIAVSPYRSRSNGPAQHTKRLLECELWDKMFSTSSLQDPKAVIQEVISGPTSTSSIDISLSRRSLTAKTIDSEVGCIRGKPFGPRKSGSAADLERTRRRTGNRRRRSYPPDVPDNSRPVTPWFQTTNEMVSLSGDRNGAPIGPEDSGGDVQGVCIDVHEADACEVAEQEVRSAATHPHNSCGNNTDDTAMGQEYDHGREKAQEILCARAEDDASPNGQRGVCENPGKESREGRGDEAGVELSSRKSSSDRTRGYEAYQWV